ncbi:MAG: leucine-rich repeat domain-containing protein [Mycoplasma sp.]
MGLKKLAKKQIIGIIIGSTLFIGGSLSLGHFFISCAPLIKDKNNSDEDLLPPIIQKTTKVSSKVWNDTLSNFKESINFIDSSSPISNFTSHFDLIDGVIDAEYHIIDFGKLVNTTEKQTQEITILASQAFQNSEEPLSDVILKTNLTINSSPENPDPEPVYKTTKVSPKVWDGTLSDFKDAIGFVNETTPIQNFSKHFNLIDGVIGSEYKIIDFGNLTKTSETQTQEITILASQAFQNSEQPLNNVILKTNLTVNLLPEPEPVKKTTVITLKDEYKEYSNSLDDLKLQLGWTSSSASIDLEKLETVFNTTDLVADATYKIQFVVLNSDTFVQSNILRLNPSKVYDSNGEIDQYSQFNFNFTTKEQVPPIDWNEVFTFNNSTERKLKFNSTWAYSDAANNWDGNLVIPKKLDGIEVLGLNDNFISQFAITNMRIKTLTFEEGVNIKEIPKDAFANCGLGGDIILPTSVTKIGIGAFSKSKKIKSVSLHEGLKIIERSAFFETTGLEGDIVIPSSLTTLGSEAFYNCTNIKGLYFEDAVETLTIDENAFFGCSGIENEIIFPKRIDRISQNAFANCSSIPKITFNEGLKVLYTDAFKNCTSLSGELVLPDSLLSSGMGYSIFSGCDPTKLLSITAKSHIFDLHINNLNRSWSSDYWNGLFDSESNILCK